PTWSDKLLQEVIRSLLEAYYEPQFSDSSHGFRPGRGCHTALREIVDRGKGTKWFVEGDLVVPGNSTDDPLYVPVITQVQQSLGQGGRTYVGDCKTAALATRAFVAAGEDFYLCPLSEKQFSEDQRRELLQPVFAGTQPLQQVWRPGAKGQPDELVAEGFSVD